MAEAAAGPLEPTPASSEPEPEPEATAAAASVGAAAAEPPAAAPPAAEPPPAQPPVDASTPAAEAADAEAKEPESPSAAPPKSVMQMMREKERRSMAEADTAPGGGASKPVGSGRVWKPPAPPTTDAEPAPASVGTRRPWQPPSAADADAPAASGVASPSTDASGGGGADGMVCYMTFSESSNGSLFHHWSAMPIQGALASFAPTKPVPKFKVTANGGRTEAMRDVTKDPRRFHNAMCGFVKLAKTYAAPFTLMKQSEAVKVAIYLSGTALDIARLDAGSTAELADKLVVATVPENAVGFGGVKTMDTALFQQTGQKLGAALML